MRGWRNELKFAQNVHGYIVVLYNQTVLHKDIITNSLLNFQVYQSIFKNVQIPPQIIYNIWYLKTCFKISGTWEKPIKCIFWIVTNHLLQLIMALYCKVILPWCSLTFLFSKHFVVFLLLRPCLTTTQLSVNDKSVTSLQAAKD